MSEFRGRLKSLMQKYNVTEEYVFNADPIALYYKRFPSTTVCSKDNAKDLMGTNAMKSKDRITHMVCTSSVGKNVPCICHMSEHRRSQDVLSKQTMILWRDIQAINVRGLIEVLRNGGLKIILRHGLIKLCDRINDTVL